MNQLAPLPVSALQLPALVAAAGNKASTRFLEFFAANIRNSSTRRAYSRAVGEFLAWCEKHGLESLIDIEPLHVATWIESQLRAGLAAPSVKQQLAALRHLFDWLVVGQIMPTNPAEARKLLDSIDVSTPIGLRDRALIALMVYSFARIGAALSMHVEDVYTQRRRLSLGLHEKGGKKHKMPCHHNLEEYLTAYIDGCGLRDDPKGPLFRTVPNRGGRLTRTAMTQPDAYRMIGRRAAAAQIATKVGNHSFRATGITAYLNNNGTLEKAAAMANHASTRTTQLYDRRREEMSLDEVERIGI
jgi:site-specific recombinase XerD